MDIECGAQNGQQKLNKKLYVSGCWDFGAVRSDGVSVPTTFNGVQFEQEGRVVTDRESKRPIALEKQNAWGAMIKDFADKCFTIIGWGDDMEKLGERFGFTCLNAHLATAQVWKHNKPTNGGSMSLNELIPNFRIREQEDHSSVADSSDTVKVLKALFAQPELANLN